jgi:hypothetical protein
MLPHLCVDFSAEALATNDVTGEVMCMLSSEDEVRDLLGIKPLGDCARVIIMIRYIKARSALPKVYSIDDDRNPEEITTWSVGQLAKVLTAVEALNDIAPILKEHRMAGDVIMDMDLGMVATNLSFSVKQRLAFKKEVLALRARVDAGCTDVTTVVLGLCKCSDVVF